MKVKQKSVVSMLAEMGIDTADKWPLERLEKKLKNLPKLVKEEELSAKTKEGKTLLKEILAAVKEDDEIEILTGTSASKPEAKAEKAPAKKTPKVEEEEAADEEGESEEATEEEEEATEEEENEEPAEEEEEKPAAKKGDKKKGTPIKSAGGDGKPGIIASIVEFLQAATEEEPISKKKMLAKLEKRFTDRPAEGMMRTINVQVPNRIKNDKGLIVSKNDKGYWISGKVKKAAAKTESED